MADHQQILPLGVQEGCQSLHAGSVCAGQVRVYHVSFGGTWYGLRTLCDNAAEWRRRNGFDVRLATAIELLEHRAQQHAEAEDGT
jgi:hypothetical protein